MIVARYSGGNTSNWRRSPIATGIYQAHFLRKKMQSGWALIYSSDRLDQVVLGRDKDRFNLTAMVITALFGGN
jgi:hypothetical protein